MTTQLKIQAGNHPGKEVVVTVTNPDTGIVVSTSVLSPGGELVVHVWDNLVMSVNERDRVTENVDAHSNSAWQSASELHLATPKLHAADEKPADPVLEAGRPDPQIPDHGSEESYNASLTDWPAAESDKQ